MKRRDFVKKVGAATAGAFVAPYILPSGRLFAASGSRAVNHVVFCMFAGGVRNLESVQKAEGNLMRSMLSGTEAISPDILPAIQPLPASPLAQPLQNYGTLFKDFRYGFGPTGHYNGHATAITGNYTTADLSIRDNPNMPTVFEYYRKHNLPQQTALSAWWISNSLGPYPALNYSKYPGYGAEYGANFIAPTFLITPDTHDAIGNPHVFSSTEEAVVKNIKSFMDNNFPMNYQNNSAGVTNTEADAAIINTFINNLFALQQSNPGQFYDPWNIGQGLMNNDMYNVAFAERIITYLASLNRAPELLVVNMQDVDICHTNFSQYCNNLRKADWAVAHLWKTIESTPGMAGNTVLIVAPEHGRNQVANSLIDAYGRFALDHTAPDPLQGGDQMAREIFCLVAGPPGVVVQNQVINATQGESIEIVSLISNILGYDNDIPAGLLKPYVNCGIQQAMF